MKVACLFPITNNAKQYPQILEYFSKEIKPQLTLLGATDGAITFPGSDYTFVATNETLEGKPKGKGIIGSIKNLATKPDVVIVCDGSGKIPYKYVLDIFQELTSDSSICCVMANRGENKAIGLFRYLIERFEIFILKQFHHHKNNIPDGQCGLWAYRFGPINNNGETKKISLSADSYEIELDLLGEVLEKKLNYSFVNIELPKIDTHSSFTYENNIIKMRFLLNKYTTLKDYLIEILDQFERTDEFKQSYDNEIEANWNNYKIDILKLIES